MDFGSWIFWNFEIAVFWASVYLTLVTKGYYNICFVNSWSSNIFIINLLTNPYSIVLLVSIQFQQRWDYVKTVLIQRCITVLQHCFDAVSTSGSDVASTLCNIKNPTSDFASVSTSDHRYFNVDLQRWNNVDRRLKYWLGMFFFNFSSKPFWRSSFSLLMAEVRILQPVTL